MQASTRCLQCALQGQGEAGHRTAWQRLPKACTGGHSCPDACGFTVPSEGDAPPCPPSPWDWHCRASDQVAPLPVSGKDLCPVPSLRSWKQMPISGVCLYLLATEKQVTQTQPIPVFHSPGHCDWCREGHVTSAGQSQCFPGILLGGEGEHPSCSSGLERNTGKWSPRWGVPRQPGTPLSSPSNGGTV